VVGGFERLAFGRRCQRGDNQTSMPEGRGRVFHRTMIRRAVQTVCWHLDYSVPSSRVNWPTALLKVEKTSFENAWVFVKSCRGRGDVVLPREKGGTGP